MDDHKKEDGEDYVERCEKEIPMLSAIHESILENISDEMAFEKNNSLENCFSSIVVIIATLQRLINLPKTEEAKSEDLCYAIGILMRDSRMFKNLDRSRARFENEPLDFLLYLYCHKAAVIAIKRKGYAEAILMIDIIDNRYISQARFSNYTYFKPVENCKFVHGDMDPGELDEFLKTRNSSTMIIKIYLCPIIRRIVTLVTLRSDTEIFSEVFTIMEEERYNDVQFLADCFLSSLSSDDPLGAMRNFSYLSQIFSDLFSEIANIIQKFTISSIIFVPSPEIFNVPFHALSYSNKEQSLADLVDDTSYCPSLFRAVSGTPKIDIQPNLDTPLQFTGDFVKTATGLFSLKCLLAANTHLGVSLNSAPTNDFLSSGLRRHPFVHIECHGVCDPEPAILFQDAIITHKQFFESIELDCCFLLFLNGCNTGVNKRSKVGRNQIYGIDTAALARGAQFVVSTIGPVTELATVLITYKFYSEFFTKSARYFSPEKSLNKAVKWLRDGDWYDEKDQIIKTFQQPLPGPLSHYEWICEAQIGPILEFLNLLPKNEFSLGIFWTLWRCLR